VTDLNGLRVAFLGLECGFSIPPLQALLQAGARVELVAVPGEQPGVNWRPLAGRLPLAGHESILELAWQQKIPIAAIGSFDDEALTLLAGVDIGVVACFTRRIPGPALAAPGLGWVNLHPSLLPRHRGPNPLFWSIRNDEAETGITLHRMTDTLDAGPILAQERVSIASGDTYGEIERDLAERGARLLPGVLRELQRSPWGFGQVQDEADATYEPAPAEADFAIDPAWPAGRTFRFARALSDWGYSWIAFGGRRWFVLDAVFHNDPAPERIEVDGQSMRISNAGGAVLLRIQER
jgi:methionyl-tRNA formyltransferase